jgi:hypothetical protein
VHLLCETSTHYFWFSDGTGTDCTKSGSRSAFPCVHGAKHQFTIFMLGWDRCGLQKKCARTHYAEHVFLHLVGSVSHIVHSGGIGAQNVDTLFSCLGGTGMDSTKIAPEHIMLTHVLLHVGAKHRCTLFLAQVGLVRIAQKMCRNTLRKICVFASSWICGSPSAFQGV